MMPKSRAKSRSQSIQDYKMKKVADEFKAGTLHSGSKTGPLVKNRKQMIAIGLSEGKAYAKKGKY